METEEILEGREDKTEAECMKNSKCTNHGEKHKLKQERNKNVNRKSTTHRRKEEGKNERDVENENEEGNNEVEENKEGLDEIEERKERRERQGRERRERGDSETKEKFRDRSDDKNDKVASLRKRYSLDSTEEGKQEASEEKEDRRRERKRGRDRDRDRDRERRERETKRNKVNSRERGEEDNKDQEIEMDEDVEEDIDETDAHKERDKDRRRDHDRDRDRDRHRHRHSHRHGERRHRDRSDRHATRSRSRSKGRHRDLEKEEERERRRRRLNPNLSYSHERSRSRERKRRKLQAECIRKAGGFRRLADLEGHDTTNIFWDGFQWVAKTNQPPNFQLDAAVMNATRKLRRLYFGNLPFHMGLTENSFQEIVFEEMKKRKFCNDENINPVLYVWFAKDKGNYGFVEFATVEETERALTMDGMTCFGVTLKVSRPNDYSTAVVKHHAQILMDTLSQTKSIEESKQITEALLATNLASLNPSLSSVTSPLLGTNSGTHSVNKNMSPNIKDNLKNSESVTRDAVTSLGILANQLNFKDMSNTSLKHSSQNSFYNPQNNNNNNIQTSYLRVVQIVTAEEIENENESSLLEDIKEGFHGQGLIIQAVLITSENVKNTPFNIGDVIIEFETPIGVNNCLKNMLGKKYEGRFIRMEKCDEKTFNTFVRPIIDQMYNQNTAY